MGNDYSNKLFRIFKAAVFLLLGFGFQVTFAQNSCATALPIGPGMYTVAAIDGTNLSNAACSTATLGEWYVYTPTANHSVTITSDLNINICKDTNFSVYTGSCSGLTCYAQDDDSGIIACNVGNTNSYLSVKTFDVFAGVTYYIVWDNTWNTLGFDFQLSEVPLVPSPCASATAVTAGTTTVAPLTGNNISTTCSTATLAKWYTYTPSQSYHLTITSDLAANICKDTNFSVYTGTCAGGLTCVSSDDDSGVIACNVGNTNSLLSTKTFDVNGGTTYYIVWDNKHSAEGFTFQIIQNVIVQPVSYTNVVDATINSTYKMCIVDMNGDSKDDIVGVSASNLRVHSQQGAGLFAITDFPFTGASNMPSWSMCAGDYNKDGFNDLLLGSGGGLSWLRSNSTGSAYTGVTPGEYIFCQRTNFIDMNSDGNLDAFSCHDVDPNVYYLNNGAGGMTYYQSGTTAGAYNVGITASGGNYASLWADFDNDGDSDLLISKCSGPPCEIHRNDGPAGFTDISAAAGINFQPVSSWSSSVADFDNDGDMDILIGSNGSAPSRLFKNNHDLTNTISFSNVTAGSGWDTNTVTNRDYISYDFDNDGWVDILGGGNKIMFNQGDGTFLGTVYAGGISVGAVGDLNGDGFLDILNGGTVRYAVPNGNSWVSVALHGIQSNSNGIGARVEVYGSFGKKIRDIRSGEGFGYMSSLNAHFGLGSATSISRVIVRWPSGNVDAIDFPSINQTISFVEGLNPLSTEQMTSSSFSVYPNPADDVLNIKMGTTMEEVSGAEIFDISGRLLVESTVSDGTVSVKELSTGTYVLLLKTKDGHRYSQKFLKK